ncbi:MAG: hypothetical protein AB8F26_02035 [Phycisphaerales bacterium]
MKPTNDPINTPSGGYSIDPELAEIADQLDAMAARDSEAPAGLEDRVLQAVAMTVAPKPIAIKERATFWQSGGLRLAAAVLLLSSIGAVIFSSSINSTPASTDIVSVAMVEERIDALLAMESDESESFGESIASIELWVDVMNSEVSNGWLSTDLNELQFGNEGAL